MTQFIELPLIHKDDETPPSAAFNVAHIIVIEPRNGGGARITVSDGSGGVTYETPWTTRQVLSSTGNHGKVAAERGRKSGSKQRSSGQGWDSCSLRQGFEPQERRNR